MVGINITKADLDNLLGGTSRDLLNSAIRTIVIRQQVDAMTDAQLTALGYGAPDITLMRALCKDWREFGQLFYGQVAANQTVTIDAVINPDGTQQTNTTLRDYTANMNQVCGLRMP